MNAACNHSVRATVVTDLKEAGYSNHEVCAITGHQNEGSLKHDQIDCRGAERPATMADVLEGNEAKRPCYTHPSSAASSLKADDGPSHPGPPSTVGGIRLSVHAVIHRLTLNFTWADGQSDNKQQIEYSQESPSTKCSIFEFLL